MHRTQALTLALGIALLAPAASASAAPQSQSFGFSNGTQRFTVPAGIHQIHLNAVGGSGGAGGFRGGLYGAPGGLGAKLDVDAAVNPGDTLLIQVGGRGGAGNNQIAGDGAGAGGGLRTGGTGGTVNNRTLDGTAGGGGGGATTVIAATGAPILVAGGGGGGGGGGNQSGYNGGQGGDSGNAASGHCDPFRGPGEWGNGTGGGAGGQCAQPQNGPGGIGGAGEAPASGAGTGGGGGGGLIGGGGGSAGGAHSALSGGAGGGGAGTSYWSPVTSNAQVTNGAPGYGEVLVSWDPTPPSGVQHSATFSDSQHFTVPAGVTELTVTGWGASGGAGGDAVDGHIAPRGGYGAAIRERVTVAPGDDLAIDAGRAGGHGSLEQGSDVDPIPGGSGGTATVAGRGGAAGSVTVRSGQGGDYFGATGGGGGAATLVTNTTRSTVLLRAGGGGGGGGDVSTASAGTNGGPGGNAGNPLTGGDGGGQYGSGLSTPGPANGAGGVFASARTANGEPSADSTEGNDRGTGGGGGGGVNGGGAGQQCTGFSCALSGGGGGAGSSAWDHTAREVSFGNSLAGNGGVRISWVSAVSSSVGLASSADAVVAGKPLTLTATVAGFEAPAGRAPTGSVRFIDADSGYAIGTPVALGSSAPYTAKLVASLEAGTHHIYASYDGDSLFGPSTSPQYRVNAVAQLTVSATTLPAVEVGEPYSVTLTANGGAAPYRWSVSAGVLPAGLRLDASTGELSGVPSAAGRVEFSVRASDAGTPDQAADRPLTLVVEPASLALATVAPGALEVGADDVAVTLTGKRFLPGLELRASDSRIAFSSVVVESPTTVTAHVSVPAGVPAGVFDVTVVEGPASATCGNCLRVTAPVEAPTVKSTPATPPAPTGTSAPAAPAVPRLELVRAAAVVHRNQVRFTVRCAAATCTGRATEIAKGRTVATARFTVQAGTTRTITLRLGAAGRRLLARTGKLPVRVTIGAAQARLTLRASR